MVSVRYFCHIGEEGNCQREVVLRNEASTVIKLTVGVFEIRLWEEYGRV